ncbi:hypothetical protein [Conexibacter woesei]|uniref:Ig-like domain-containing protein n=1 Tax=Conexibacter woesei (strain DSM 14684 / CCUG 47730 / CIP 108061 / JCM 11494 / NBRC 100937 / ID131577) TaxID=469383 RepID=D3F0B8_CONWI|nr:hypothetical protein [Conexibacter woesei]ADB51978.1 hypothetical protein Cwoe_3560 [Conexibacter woesei DSM 14684]
MGTKIRSPFAPGLLAALVLAAAPAAALAAPAATQPPTIGGAVRFGEAVRCEPGQWSGDPASFRYDWIVNGSSRGSGQTFAIDDPYYVSYPLACQVTATDAAGASGVAGSAPVQPGRGTPKVTIGRFVAQPRGRILVTGKVAPLSITREWGGGSVVLRRSVPGRSGAVYQLSERPAAIGRDGSFRAAGIDAPGRWKIRVDVVPSAINLWEAPSVTRTLRISRGGRSCGGCSLIG